MDDGKTPLPRPFYSQPWRGSQASAAQALWHWHVALMTPEIFGLEGDDLVAYIHAEQERVTAGEVAGIVPEDVRLAAYAACEAHRLPRALLAQQVAGSHFFASPYRFERGSDLNRFVDQWAVPHGRLLAHLADAAHSWQLRMVDELATAFFLVGRLAELPVDLKADRLFFPLTDLAQAGVTVEQLHEGRVDESMRRFMWKQSIRARDAFAQGMPLVDEVSPRIARSIKRWWLGGLELLTLIERRDYDVWSRPIEVSTWHRIQVGFQARFARATFRKR
jgi:15-cis-phytoene synthase